MTDTNVVVLVGRLVKGVLDDERGFVQVGQTSKASFTIAVNRSVKKGEQWQDEASFFDVTVWGRTAENLKNYLVKGQQVCVEGYLKQDRWEKDGQKFSKIVVNADNVQLVGGKKDGNGQSARGGGQGFNPSEGFPEDLKF